LFGLDSFLVDFEQLIDVASDILFLQASFTMSGFCLMNFISSISLNQNLKIKMKNDDVKFKIH